MAPVQLAPRNGEAQIREALDQPTEGEATLHPSERSAEAEVDAVAEAEVADVGALEVEGVGSFMARRVAVGRCEVDDHLSADGNGDPSDLDRLQREAERRV